MKFPRVLFFGTPQVAVPFFDWLITNSNTVGLVCRPDEPVGRGYVLTPPPTKKLALEKNIPVFQPQGPWTDEFLEQIRALKPDVGIVVAYGRIMPEKVYSLPALGCLNLHFSLLPKYRGAAPVQWSLIHGETESGVSAFWLDQSMDSGPIFHQQKISIDPQDDARTLWKKLTPVGLSVLERVIKDLSAGTVTRHPQAGQPTFAPLLKKETGLIDWLKPADEIVNLIRGVCEWPGAATLYKAFDGSQKHLKILKAVKVSDADGKPGQVMDAIKDQGFVVQAGKGRVLLLEVQPEGKKAMSGWAFWQGARLKIGASLYE